MAAKQKATREGVQSLTSEDIRGLSLEQIKELRGYQAIADMGQVETQERHQLVNRRDRYPFIPQPALLLRLPSA
jgi:hypothetical protein